MVFDSQIKISRTKDMSEHRPDNDEKNKADELQRRDLIWLLILFVIMGLAIVAASIFGEMI